MKRSIMHQLGYSAEYLGKCPFCQTLIHIESFTDQLSVKEFGISGICQKCQDKVFSCPPEDEEDY